jgi:glycosyltransferase involved in cell wall biosynthesis
MNKPSGKGVQTNCLSTIALLAIWSLKKVGDSYYAPYTNYIYLEFISRQYEKVYILTPIIPGEADQESKKLNSSKIIVVELPFSSSYLNAQIHFPAYYKAVKHIVPHVDKFYCRVPDPFSWIPRLLFSQNVIMHFVGDSIDATNYNEQWSTLKKKIMISGYYPDYILTILAARKSEVFTNGFHLADKLKLTYRVKATPVVSSTVRETDVQNTSLGKLSDAQVRLTYVGYLRYSKGIKTIIGLVKEMNSLDIDYQFNIVGAGEMYSDIYDLIHKNKLQSRVILHGHVENRNEVNRLLKNTDLFFFPSLSEGSPRVLVEAMSQGVPVISTPVGAAPHVFKDGQDIRFFGFNNVDEALDIIKEYMDDNKSFIKQRENAFYLVKEKYTLEKFLGKIFRK